jgi:hypothetical protein
LIDNSPAAYQKYLEVDRAAAASMTQYAKGGLANFTGPAWLDGTPGKPERVLSPEQTMLFEDLVASLHNIKVQTPRIDFNALPNLKTGGTGGVGGMGDVTFGDIILNVERLDRDQDMELLVDRFEEEMQRRVRKGKAVGGLFFGL